MKILFDILKYSDDQDGFILRNKTFRVKVESI